MSFIIGIDGPAGSGKGTLTKLIAKKFGLTHIDTGITYRAVAKAVLDNNIKLDEKEKIIEIARNVDIQIVPEENVDKVFLNGKDVTQDIRSKEVTAIVSQVSSIKEVRLLMVELQRKLAKGKNVIMEGRDICTYVFPNADIKIYLKASLEERARRRFEENKQKGINMSYEEILESIKLRDENDMHKEIGSLQVAEDSIVVDTTGLEIEQSLEKLSKIIEERIKEIKI